MPPKKGRPSKAKRTQKSRSSGSAKDAISLFEVAFRYSGDGQFLLSDEDGRFVEVNERFLTMTGYSREGVESGQVTPANLVVEQSVTGGGERAKRGVLGALLPGQDP
ncbi:MAG: PAS domain S-box protein, partial [Planctomycetota bacterium]|nr:PAS domain S-box protein [Planctomycetota bacterium]